MQIVENLVGQINTLVFAKDLSHRYTYGNEAFAQTCGEDSPQSCIGKKDENLIWRKYAHLYSDGDDKVYQGQRLCNALEPVRSPQDEIFMLVNKQPLLNKRGEIAGVLCSSINVTDLIIFKKETQNKTYNDRFKLGKYFDNTVLSPREFHILKLILLGKTAKEIAHLFKISPKTIETHISRIKIKMQCRTRGDIIAQAVISGLYYRLAGELHMPNE